MRAGRDIMIWLRLRRGCEANEEDLDEDMKIQACSFAISDRRVVIYAWSKGQQCLRGNETTIRPQYAGFHVRYGCMHNDNESNIMILSQFTFLT